MLQWHDDLIRILEFESTFLSLRSTSVSHKGGYRSVRGLKKQILWIKMLQNPSAFSQGTLNLINNPLVIQFQMDLKSVHLEDCRVLYLILIWFLLERYL